MAGFQTLQQSLWTPPASLVQTTEPWPQRFSVLSVCSGKCSTHQRLGEKTSAQPGGCGVGGNSSPQDHIFIKNKYMSRNKFISSHINPYSKFRYLKTLARAGDVPPTQNKVRFSGSIHHSELGQERSVI